MIKKHFSEENWVVRICCQKNHQIFYHKQHSLTPIGFPSNQSSKISLKRLKNRPNQNTHPHSTIKEQFSRHHSFATLPNTSKNSKYLLPKIVFSWSNPQIEAPHSQIENQQNSEIPLVQDKLEPNKQNRMKYLAYRGSLVSIKSNSSMKNAKFQQSVILVDYFHPDSAQVNKMQPYLQKVRNSE